MLGIGTIARKVFGTANDRKVKGVRKLVARINALEPDMAALADTDFPAKTAEFKERVANGETLDAILPEAFALAREGAKRAIGLRPFDVQLVGGIFLHQGNISEMKTGEGKTLVATLPAYLNALTGRGVHVVTVNDYLARRDADWMGQVYAFLGMTTGINVPGISEPEKLDAYAADITYGTNNEFGFDYLRDNLKADLKDIAQRDHYFAIIDEVDSILIDEARTPLIISGPTEDRSDLYITIDKLIPQVIEEHFELDEKSRAVSLTDAGNEFFEELLKAEGLLEQDASLYDIESTTMVHHVTQGLRAHKLFLKDKDYIVRNGEVVLIDVFTGRMMPGRRLSEGLHQALEAKEGTDIKPENITLASVTFQNYFRLYEKLGGMTGTALTEADEFQEIYNLGVVAIPTNKPVARIDEHDQVYRTEAEKYAAIVEEIKVAHAKGQPILVGTTSIEKSEALSTMLTTAKVPHQVLNARFHEQEALIIAQAGQPGAVTIATNMAGRGTDIKLGGNADLLFEDKAKDIEESVERDRIRAEVEAEVAENEWKVLEAGGLYVLATERHESRRIDNQLRGRSGRQGDPGRTAFFLSLDDDLMRIFGSERLDKMLGRLGMKDGEAIVHPWVNKALERAQGKVEGRNFDIRKNILKYDDVMNEQRKAIFGQRREIMASDDLSEIIEDMQEEFVSELVSVHVPERAYADQWDTEGLQREVHENLGLDLPIVEWGDEEGTDDETLRERIMDSLQSMMADKTTQIGVEQMRRFEKQVLLNSIDQQWQDHLITLDHLRSVVGFRGYAQRDPLNEFKTEAFALFDTLLNSLRAQVTKRLATVRVMTPEEQEQMMAELRARAEAQRQAMEAAQQTNRPDPAPVQGEKRGAVTYGQPRQITSVAAEERDPEREETWGKVGRNEACPCGSGKKYKHCHGQL